MGNGSEDHRRVISMYNIFGSEDSVDCDVMFFVPAIGSVAESKALIATLSEELQKTQEKKVNGNLAVVSNGAVIEVFKGTADEVNNSLLTTYDYHHQEFPSQVMQHLPRDAGMKSLRSMRAILSFMSRTMYRGPIKAALTGSAVDKHSLLKEIVLALKLDLGHKNITQVDFYKMAAFQMGQSYLLNTGVEVYTKQAIASNCESLRPYLERRESDSAAIDAFKTLWLESFDPNMIPQYEELRK